MAYEKAAVRHARMMRETRERCEQENQALIAEVVAEFAGDVARMAEEILYWRGRMGRLGEVVAKLETREPFVVMGAGPHWQPGDRKLGWWR
jgi:hypothetical protein